MWEAIKYNKKDSETWLEIMIALNRVIECILEYELTEEFNDKDSKT
jgi:hypothetical protein